MRAVHHSVIIQVTKVLSKTPDLSFAEALVNIQYSPSLEVELYGFEEIHEDTHDRNYKDSITD